MKIKKLDYDFSVCKVKDYSEVHFDNEYCFLGKTDEEYSLVCINDNKHIKNYDQLMNQIQEAFESILPEKSSFEL